MYKSHNELVGSLVKRTKELGDLTLPALREIAGYNCDTPAEARSVHKHETRGSLIEIILCEEFLLESDIDFQGE